MSQNIFRIDPIFFLPIDLEDNSKILSDEEQNDCDTPEEEHNNALIKKDKIDLNDCKTNEYSSKGKELVQIFVSNINKNQISKENDKEKINPKKNTNKIFISQFFKENWKIKSRRLITKLKKKLIKQYKNSCLKNNDNKNIDILNFYINNMKKNMNTNINNIFDCNNNFICNNLSTINNNIIYNCNCSKGNNIENPNNICTNININFNQYNNNYQIIDNSDNLLCNDCVFNQYKNLLNLSDFFNF
jgi:hypothetical protein